MKIVLRTENGWSDEIENENEQTCDKCGAVLWIAPHGKKYCNQVHKEN